MLAAGRAYHRDVFAAIGQTFIDVLCQGTNANENVVIFTRHMGNPAFNNTLDVVADQRAGNGRHRNREDGDAQDDHCQGEKTRIGGMRDDVTKAYGGHHHDGEVERRWQVRHRRCKAITDVERAQRAVDDQ